MTKWMTFSAIRKLPKPFILASAVLISAACIRADDRAAYDRSSLETLVRYLLLWGPEVKLDFEAPRPSPIAGYKEVRVRATYGEGSQTETLFVSDDGKRVIQGSVYDVNRDPFRRVAERISLQNQPRRGPPNAPLALVVFSDFECPMCRRLADDLKSNVEKTYRGQASIYFKDLPLAARHPWAVEAAVAGRCVFHQNPEAFWAYHDWIFAHQSEITLDKFREHALTAIQSTSINREKLVSCMDSRETEPEIKESQREASDLGVSGTPTVFLNGRKMPGPSWPHLRSAIDFELKKKTADDCHCVEDPTGKDP